MRYLLAILLPTALVLRADRAYQQKRRMIRHSERWIRERDEQRQEIMLYVDLLRRVRQHTA